MSDNTMSNSVTQRWIPVCPLEEILPDSGICAWLEQRQIAIFRVGDGNDLYALDNYDPIGEANVLSRGLVGDLQGALVVASPLYKQHFNLATGRCLEQDEVVITTYPVRVSDGQVEVALVSE